MRFDAYFFDFDGVLAASEVYHHRGYNRVLEATGQALDFAEFRARYVHLDDTALFRTLARDRGLDWGETRAAEMAREVQRQFLDSLKEDIFYPGMAALVRRLKPTAPLAVVSMGDRAMLDRALDLAGVAACFSTIVSPADVKNPKPDPEAYLLALARVRALRDPDLRPERCLVMEDSRGGVLSGKAAGMAVAALTHNQTADVLKAAGADWILENVAALDRFLA